MSHSFNNAREIARQRITATKPFFWILTNRSTPARRSQDDAERPSHARLNPPGKPKLITIQARSQILQYFQISRICTQTADKQTKKHVQEQHTIYASIVFKSTASTERLLNLRGMKYILQCDLRSKMEAQCAQLGFPEEWRSLKKNCEWKLISEWRLLGNGVGSEWRWIWAPSAYLRRLRDGFVQRIEASARRIVAASINRCRRNRRRESLERFTTQQSCPLRKIPARVSPPVKHEYQPSITHVLREPGLHVVH